MYLCVYECMHFKVFVRIFIIIVYGMFSEAYSAYSAMYTFGGGGGGWGVGVGMGAQRQRKNK